MDHTDCGNTRGDQAWPGLVPGDTIAYVRSIEVSCTESPYVLLSIHFTGPCDISCQDCHSRALWVEKDTDRTTLSQIMNTILHYHEAGVIDGICILGTDGTSKKLLSPHLVRFARARGLKTVVFAGADIDIAMAHYGRPDYFVSGPYRSGEWHESKAFYVKEGTGYREISMQQYFTLPTEGGAHGDQIQL